MRLLHDFCVTSQASPPPSPFSISPSDFLQAMNRTDRSRFNFTRHVFAPFVHPWRKTPQGLFRATISPGRHCSPSTQVFFWHTLLQPDPDPHRLQTD